MAMDDDDDRESSFESSAGDAKVVRHAEDGSERTISSKKNQRDQLQSDIEAFLKKGGKVQDIDPHVTADPPKKPESSYGSRPI